MSEAATLQQTISPWWRKTWIQNVILVAVAIVGVYVLIYRDVVSRARESYQEAEKYMEWYQHPEKKQEYFENQFSVEKGKLDELRKKEKITEQEYRDKLDVAKFDKDFVLGESSLKYAYQWYKDTYELFSPPESKWVKMAREKAPATLELWKQELRQKKIPIEDYMFE